MSDLHTLLAAVNIDDDLSLAWRDLLIAQGDIGGVDTEGFSVTKVQILETLTDLLGALIEDPYRRDELTDLLLGESLCPLHFCDYAICFDDQNPECLPIRTIHPSHDT